MTAPEIARFLGCSAPSVYHALRKFEIPVRPMAESRKGQPNRTDWTPELRERLAAQKRGTANAMFGTISPNRGQNWDPDPKVARTRISRQYRVGISGPEYDVMHERQVGCCAICGGPEKRKHSISGTPFTLAVDHDHVTGRIRDLLCNRCNTVLGHVQDDPELLRKAADYLDRHRI